MNKNEFESRIGKTVSDARYKVIEQVYMAAGDNVDKDVFCAMYKNKDFDLCVVLAERIENLKWMYDAQTNNLNLLSRKVLETTDTIDGVYPEESRQLNSIIASVIGTREYLKIKLEHNYELNENDRNLLINLL